MPSDSTRCRGVLHANGRTLLARRPRRQPLTPASDRRDRPSGDGEARSFRPEPMLRSRASPVPSLVRVHDPSESTGFRLCLRSRRGSAAERDVSELFRVITPSATDPFPHAEILRHEAEDFGIDIHGLLLVFAFTRFIPLTITDSAMRTLQSASPVCCHMFLVQFVIPD